MFSTFSAHIFSHEQHTQAINNEHSQARKAFIKASRGQHEPIAVTCGSYHVQPTTPRSPLVNITLVFYKKQLYKKPALNSLKI